MRNEHVRDTGHVQVGSVIRNPEVSGLVPVLLAAIADTSKHTRPTLEVRPALDRFMQSFSFAAARRSRGHAI